MRKKIAFFTGARSEYGIMKGLIKSLYDSPDVECLIIASGMHLVKSFGHTVEEIESDGFIVAKKIFAYKENLAPNVDEFTQIVSETCDYLKQEKPRVMFLIGDRPESYAAALGAHFAKVPIIHSGGGAITEGAVDNIYRYNISNLSTYHFSTSMNNYKRLCNLPVLKKDNIFFIGSFAIDAILKFKDQAIPINAYFPQLNRNEFVLMTFHSATVSEDKIAEFMANLLNYLVSRNVKVLITYPNNDQGYEEIIDVIETYRHVEEVVIVKHLGSQRYYSALNDCMFVIGNSSSGLIEAPYFHKNVINVGDRQKGREMDECVIDLPCKFEEAKNVLDYEFSVGWNEIKNNQVFGDGNALITALDVIRNKILSD
jgi:UDP-hydrolysing UDP-N-acetyl-D-glucosamine 2-epimerase